MTTAKMNEQIASFRKQKGLTQEELAHALGVTNQAVSKWESAQCCPDIQLLPAIAALFDVTVDQLIGYSTTGNLREVCFRIRAYFTTLPEGESFENAYRIAALLHEVMVTDGYKKQLPWAKDNDYSIEEVQTWGISACSEPEGSTVRKDNNVFFTLGKGYLPPTTLQLRNLLLNMQRWNHLCTLRVMYSLYGLTLHDFDRYVSSEEIAHEAHLTIDEVEAELKQLPVTAKEENQQFLYRLNGAFAHIPPLLSFFMHSPIQ